MICHNSLASYFLSWGPPWSWLYGSWIYNYLCNQCLSLLKLWVRIPFMRGVLNTKLCGKICQWLAAGRLFSPGTPVSSTNKTDHHDIITEILCTVIIIFLPTFIAFLRSNNTFLILISRIYQFILSLLLFDQGQPDIQCRYVCMIS
jgi:hypothetical protein